MKTLLEVLVLFYLLLLCTSYQPAMAQMSTTSSLSCSSDDIDTNDNNLIDICDIDGFNGIHENESGYGTSIEGCKSFCDGYELMNDLDFAGQDWEPIPYFNAVFNTTNTTGYTISNLSINTPKTDNSVGLFEEIGPDAKINNFRLLNANVIGKDSVGGLAGRNDGEITNSCIVNLDGTRKIKGEDKVGALVGDNIGGVIRNSCAISIVEGIDIVGGLVGSNNSTGIIANSYATGDISESIAISVVGGLVGENISRSTIANSYATGKVTGNLAGGLVGWNAIGIIRNSYATGKVTGVTREDSARVGGLVGQNSVGGIIANSYATGNVTGTGQGAAGGLIGLLSGGDTMNSYAIGSVKDDGEGEIGSLVGLMQGGEIAYSYAKDEAKLVGFVPDDVRENITASFTADILTLRSPTGPSNTSTEVYYQWSEDDWDFGTEKQRPILKYTKGSNEEMPLCNGLKLPPCDTSLPGQRANIYTHIRVLLEGTLQRH